MELLTKILKRISLVFVLTFKEAIRRKIILFLVICCVLFIGSGAGCNRACQSMQESLLDNYEQKAVEHFKNSEFSIQEKQKRIESVRKKVRDKKAAEAKNLRTTFLVISFSMITFWLFTLAGIFAPFLAMNDFQNRTHVLLLARPVQRWEYLVGKFLAIGAMLIINLLILLLGTHGFTYLFLGDPGWEILRGIGIYVQGLLVFTSMVLFISLLAGRFPAVFLSIIVVVLGIVPAFQLMSGSVTEGFWRIPTYFLGYGLPQYSINYLYALSEVLRETGLMNSFRKAGNNTGLYSLFINTGWFVLFWIMSIIVLNRKELDT